MQLTDLETPPNPLAEYYSHFRVAERLLLTGHSHQAWPDCARDAQIRAWDDAARLIDDKWDAAFRMAERVRRGYAERLGDRLTGGTADDGIYVLGANTHELLIRFLSALPLAQRRRLLTTGGEFHTIRRQLSRLEEEGLEVVRLPAGEDSTVRLAAAVDDRTAAVLVSSVFFKNARIVEGFQELAAACQRVGAELLVDTYHTVNAVPFDVAEQGLEDAFLIGGGYKYCQLGEGNCFLRVPAARSDTFRPVITGWYSEFSGLGERTSEGRITYGQGPDRWAGATYDPTSHYRAAAVWDFFERQGLTSEVLRRISQHQVGLLMRLFDDLDLPPSLISRDRELPLEKTGGFLALTSSLAETLSAQLHEAGVLTDYRGEILRLGPAPYLSDRQLRDAMGILGQVARGGFIN